MNCRDEVTNRDLQDSYLAMSSKGIENHKSFSFLWDPTNDQMIKAADYLLISWCHHGHGSSLKGCGGHLCTCDVGTDQVPRRLTPSETTLTPVSAGLRVTETREKARPQSVSQSGFRLAHNKHTRTANNFSDWWSITNSTSQSHKSGEAPNKIVQYNYTHIQNTNAKCHADCRSTLDVDNCMVKGFTRNLNHDYKESLPRILLRNENSSCLAFKCSN